MSDEGKLGYDEARAFLAAIVDSSDDAIVSKDLDGIVQTWNRGAERIFGYTAAEMVGRPIVILFPEGCEHEEVEILRTIRRGGRVDHFETVRQRKDRRLIDVSVTISPIRNGAGEIVGVSKVARDVTDATTVRREREREGAEMERRVQERTAELQTAVGELESFAHSLAHDLRAPLRAIGATSRILQEDHEHCLPDEARAMLRRQVEAVARMGRLMDDLLSHASLGRLPLAAVPLDLGELATSVWQEIHPGGAPNGLRLDAAPGLRAQGDPTLVRFVLQNLLQNASKFSPRGGTIRVGQDGRGFFVSDEGVGFDMAHAKGLFEPFTRLVSQEEFSGTGIGLANVRRIVERHGGRVWAESEPGRGATFWFTLI